VSDGDAGALLVHNRCAEEGLNATDGNKFNTFFATSLTKLDDLCGYCFKNALWQHYEG